MHITLHSGRGMSIGNSGRIVIEVEPELKRQLYASLMRDGLTLKGWFTREAISYLDSSGQLLLDLKNTSSKSAHDES